MLTKVTLPISEKELSIVHPLLNPLLRALSSTNLPVRFVGSANKQNCSKSKTKALLASDAQVVYTIGNMMFCTNLHNNRISRLANNTPIPTYWDSRTWDQGIPIWRYIDTFQQNSLSIHIQITRFILVQLRDKKGIICGIGGEFYRYFILNRDSDSKKYIGISNSQSILDIAKFNLNLYRIPTDLHYVDYNTFNLDSILQEREREQEQDINLCLVNLSTIPLNLFRQLAMSNIRSIILIVCNQKVFNKRRSILESKYDLIDFTHLSSSDTTYVSVYVYSIHKTKRL